MNALKMNNKIRISFLLIAISVSFFACNNHTEEADAYGNFEAEETLVSAEMAGKLLQFNVSEGEVLERNQIIGMVDTIMPALQLYEIKAQNDKINASLANIDAQASVVMQQKANLEIDMQRTENMKTNGAATQKQYDDISGNLKVISRQIEAFAAQKNAIKKELAIVSAKELLLNEQLNKCRIANPLKGTVLQKYAEPGELTAPGKPLYKIANLNVLILRAYVSGSQLHAVKTNELCKVRIDKGEKDFIEFEGKIEWIADKAEFTPKIIQTKEERVNMVYAIKIVVKNDGTIKMGMPGEVFF